MVSRAGRMAAQGNPCTTACKLGEVTRVELGRRIPEVGSNNARQKRHRGVTAQACREKCSFDPSWQAPELGAQTAHRMACRLSATEHVVQELYGHASEVIV